MHILWCCKNQHIFKWQHILKFVISAVVMPHKFTTGITRGPSQNNSTANIIKVLCLTRTPRWTLLWFQQTITNFIPWEWSISTHCTACVTHIIRFATWLKCLQCTWLCQNNDVENIDSLTLVHHFPLRIYKCLPAASLWACKNISMISMIPSTITWVLN